MPGTYNFAGVENPAADAMIQALLEAKTEEEFVSSVRALDRVLLSGDYVIPLFHVPRQWLAHWTNLKYPEKTPLFGYNLGPRSWKQYLFPPRLRLFAARRSGRSFEIEGPEAEPPSLAFIGIRPCEIAAIEVQDRVLLGGAHVDPWYARVRETAFLVAVQCGQAAATCFCTSASTLFSLEKGPPGAWRIMTKLSISSTSSVNGAPNRRRRT